MSNIFKGAIGFAVFASFAALMMPDAPEPIPLAIAMGLCGLLGALAALCIFWD